MKKLTLAALALLATAGMAHADTCNSLTWQIESNSSLMQRETRNMGSNTEMMNASMAAGDVNSAKLYASMNKDTAIRLIGLVTEGRALLKAADAMPGNCGAADAVLKDAIKNSYDAEKSLKAAINTYKNTFN
jgi:hypothetical protein